MSTEYKIRVAAPKSEVSLDFIQGMADRMSVSFFKYGPLSNNYPTPGDALESLKKRLSKYAEDGNTEWLMDVANFAMIEYLRPTHEKAHFKATDSHESPGVKLWSGKAVHDKIADHKDSYE